jgi:catalase
MRPDERERLIGNIVASMESVPAHIQRQQIGHFKKAVPAYGAGVAQGLGLNIEDINVPSSKEVAAD